MADLVADPTPPLPSVLLPWNRFEALAEALAIGPAILLAGASSVFSVRLETMLSRLAHKGHAVHLLLFGKLAASLDSERLLRFAQVGTSLTLLAQGSSEGEEIATCLEDLSLVLGSSSADLIQGPLRWVGTPRSQEAPPLLASMLAQRLEDEEATFPVVLAAHVPFDEVPELRRELRRSVPLAPCVDGRCCPEGLRHSLRLGAFLPLMLAVEAR